MRIRDLITKQTIFEITATQPGVVVYNFSSPTNKDVTVDKIKHNAEMIRQGKAIGPIILINLLTILQMV
jgi:hypothetical protein